MTFPVVYFMPFVFFVVVTGLSDEVVYRILKFLAPTTSQCKWNIMMGVSPVKHSSIDSLIKSPEKLYVILKAAKVTFSNIRAERPFIIPLFDH